MAATQYSLYETYQSYATSAPFIASAFTDNQSQADLLQIENEGGQVVVAVDYLGNVWFNASGLTASFGVGGNGLYTANRQVIRKFRTVPGSTVTTVAQAFAAAFPLNPQSLDIIHVVSPGQSVGYYIDVNGISHGS